MSLTDSDGMNTTMLVGPTAYPAYGNNGGFGNLGGDWGWIILLLLFAGGGWGNGFGGGFGGFGGMYEFPWLLNGQAGINQNTNTGFQNALLNDNVVSIRDGVSALQTQLCNCCGDIAQQLCAGFAGVTASVTGAQNAITQQLYANQIADLNRSFDAQTAVTQGMNNIGMGLQNCCCENRANIADLKYTVATENCADRAALADGIKDVIASQTASTQRILDQLCQDKIDAKNDTINQLRQEILYARGQASQDVQTAVLRQSDATTANQLIQELRSCPIPAMPVYGQTPIFTCNSNGCGCGCANQF